MKSAIHILIVEDNQDDVEILLYELKKGGLTFTSAVVDNEPDYKRELHVHAPDIILSDYNLPLFDGRSALEIAKAMYPDVPFILISGIIGEDSAVEMIKAGCSDYLLKEKLGRLPNSIQQALTQATEHRERLRAINALVESEERFRRIADNSPVLIWKTDSENKVTYFNKGWMDFTGKVYGRDDIREPLEGIHPDDVARCDRIRKSNFGKREKYRIEYRLRYNDGTYRWILETGVPNYLPDGEFVGYLGSCIDIDERKAMEDQVIKSQAMLNTFFSESLDACFYLEMDRPFSKKVIENNSTKIESYVGDAKVSKVNNAFLHQFGSEHEEFAGKKFSELLHKSENKLNEYTLRLASEGKTKYVLRMVQKDLSEMIVEGSIVALYDSENNITGCFGIQKDITEEEKEYENLKKKADYYQRLFEDDLTGDFITRPDGNLVMVNNTCVKIFGYRDSEEMYSINMRTMYASPEERSKIIDRLNREKKVEDIEVAMRRKDGSIFNASLSAIGKFNAQGALQEIVGFVVDTSRRKEVERQLLQSQKLESIGTLASGIAHDFNNILNNILGFSNQLKKYYSIPEKVQKYAETITKSAERGTQLSSKLLSFASQKKSEMLVVDVVDVIEEVVGICQDTFMKKINIEVDIEPGLWSVKGEKGGLYQMILNLCMNSRDAILDRDNDSVPGSLKIVARNNTSIRTDLHWFSSVPPENSIHISVEDNGCGIPEEIKGRIFDPFFTTKLTGGQKGTGLGLSIVYNSVRNHHGAIDIDSTPGNGTSFNIYIPAEKPKDIEMDTQDESQYHSRHNELILLVDDEEAMRDLGQELLEEAGYRVLLAKNGIEAIEIFKKESLSIDLVILDLVMPEMDGGQTYMEMKKINQNLKAFFCSGFVTDDLITSLLSEEGLKALQKPFRAEQFIKFVHSSLYSNSFA